MKDELYSAIRAGLQSDDDREYVASCKRLPDLDRDRIARMLRELAETGLSRDVARVLPLLRTYDPNAADQAAMRILKDPTSAFITQAFHNLWKTGSMLGIMIARHHLLTHTDPYVREWAAIYLGKCGTREDLPFLHQALSDHESAHEDVPVSSTVEQSIDELEESYPQT